MRENDEQKKIETRSEDERRWFRIYALVIIYTILVITLLWLFSRLFA